VDNPYFISAVKQTQLKNLMIAATEDENSPTNQESNDSSSRTSSDDGNDENDIGAGTISLAAQGGGHERPLSPFTVDQFTHCIQDEDHDIPTSPRIPVSEANAPVDSSGSSSQWIDDLPIPGPYIYHILDIHSQQPTQWVYEWVDSELYNMCYQDWQSTAEWTNFTWQERKAHLLRTQGIMLISMKEYYAMQHAQPM
jgi:hypothetical protein